MRHSIMLYNHFKTIKNLIEEAKLDFNLDDIEVYKQEFMSSKVLMKFGVDSKEYFDYIINRLHILGLVDQYQLYIPLDYKGYTAIYSYDEKVNMYVGYVKGESDSLIKGKTLERLMDDFKNVVDYVVLMR